MTPEEKCNELIKKFGVQTRVFFEPEGWQDDLRGAKQCALICVDEIINTTSALINEDTYVETPSYLQYWQQVKEEILKN